MSERLTNAGPAPSGAELTVACVTGLATVAVQLAAVHGVAASSIANGADVAAAAPGLVAVSR